MEKCWRERKLNEKEENDREIENRWKMWERLIENRRALLEKKEWKRASERKWEWEKYWEREKDREEKEKRNQDCLWDNKYVRQSGKKNNKA